MSFAACEAEVATLRAEVATLRAALAAATAPASHAEESAPWTQSATLWSNDTAASTEGGSQVSTLLVSQTFVATTSNFAGEERRMQQTDEMSYVGGLRRFGKRMSKRLASLATEQHGNCSFVKKPNTNLLELMAVTPKQAEGLHGGRCEFRYPEIGMALAACAANPACGGVSRDNGLNCMPNTKRRQMGRQMDGPSRANMLRFELRAGTPEPRKQSLSFVCSERVRPQRQLKRADASVEQGV
eukprot:6582680-Prymnesium_polylepis.1